MVKVRQDLPTTGQGQFDVEQWFREIQQINKIENLDRLRQACEHVSKCVKPAQKYADPESGRHWSGVNCYTVGLEMVQILSELRLDEEALVAGLLYRAVREDHISLTEIEETYGSTTLKLIDGVLRMAAISAYVHPRGAFTIEDKESPRKKKAEALLGKRADQVTNLRKMLVAMVDDVRVALIKLAERTCAIRALKYASEEKQSRVSREIFDIYAPLAHRLGIGHIKWELEDLSFRYLKAEEYKRIAKQLDEKRLDRQEYITAVVDDMQSHMQRANIESQIDGRAKHIYSIWRKMHRKGLSFHQIYDIRAIRILVNHVRDCYAALGIVHSTWKHIPKEFDDYIATPKDNGYRSLHTAVLGPKGKVIEVQIRTVEMHEEAELGVCAHWLYKEGRPSHQTKGYEDKILWLRQVLDWHESLGDTDADNFISHLSQDAVDDRVYVFTRDGHVVDLSKGATPLDFAYAVHTEVGQRCKGAKVNGRIVPLHYELHTGEQVEILTSKDGKPSRDWLNPHLGYIKTSRARAKIQHWFKQQDRDEHLKDGKVILERELARVSMQHIKLIDVAQELNLKTTDDLYVAIARGDVRLGRVLQAVQKNEPFQDDVSEIVTNLQKKTTQNEHVIDIEADGVSDLMSHTAGCCKPLPGDPVLGYISLNRGIIVHQEDCPELLRLSEKEPRRVIPVDWNGFLKQGYQVDLQLEAYDRKGLLRDISQSLSDQGVNVLKFNTVTDKSKHLAHMRVTVEVNGLAELGRIITKLSQLPNMLHVKRL